MITYVLYSTSHQPHDCTHISSQVSAACSGGEVLLRVQPVGVNHEVSVSQVTGERWRRQKF